MATAKQKGKGIWQDIAHYSDEEEESSVFLTGFLKFIDVQPQSKPVSFECGICYSKFVTATTNAGSSRGPVHGQFLSCKHGYCDTCMNKYVTTKLHDGANPFPLRCPVPECQYEITEKHVQSLLTAKDYDLWKRKKEESNMNGKMYCPNKRCSKVLTISQLSRANDCLAECTHCHYAICTKCTCLWHNGYSCAQYKAIPDARKNTEDSSVLAMAKDNKWCRCTKCQALVELRYGCNHITCHCGHQFCYKCGSSWNETTRLCSTGKCDLWDEDMLILAQNDREAQPVQPVQPVQVQPAQWRPVPPVQVQPQNQRPGVQKAREININFHNLLRIPEYRHPPWLYESLHTSSCMYCPATFANIDQLKQHLETVKHHDVYYCCGKLFQTKHSLTRHRHSSNCQLEDDNHDLEYEEYYEKDYSEEEDCYEEEEELIGSDFILCNLNIYRVLRRLAATRSLNMARSILDRRCYYCHRQFSDDDKLQYHYRNTVMHPVYYCCGLLFEGEDGFDEHQGRSLCHNNYSKVFNGAQREKIKKHNFNIDLDEVMACPDKNTNRKFKECLKYTMCYYCYDAFESHYDLEDHYEKATHDVFTCCGMIFKNRLGIKVHQVGADC